FRTIASKQRVLELSIHNATCEKITRSGAVLELDLHFFQRLAVWTFATLARNLREYSPGGAASSYVHKSRTSHLPAQETAAARLCRAGPAQRRHGARSLRAGFDLSRGFSAPRAGATAVFVRSRRKSAPARRRGARVDRR